MVPTPMLFNSSSCVWLIIKKIKMAAYLVGKMIGCVFKITSFMLVINTIGFYK